MTLFALYPTEKDKIQINSDGSPLFPLSYWNADILASIAAAPREELPDPEPSTPDPDWDGFTSEFTDPTSSLFNDLYNGTATLVQQSTAFTQEHWQNIRIGLASGPLRDVVKFQNSVSYLDSLLTADSNPLNQTQKDAWVSLATQYYIPLIL
jgi:hypothetical protein